MPAAPRHDPQPASGAILVLGPDDDPIAAGLDGTDPIVDLGPATPEALAALPGPTPGSRRMMSFGPDQLPELALAVVRGVRVVRVDDVHAALAVCRTIEALEDVERASR